MKNTDESVPPFPKKDLESIINKTKQQSSTYDLSIFKGKEVIMTIGPTGAGKSTIVNLASGSSVRFEFDDDQGIWKAIADPPRFPIGHFKSCTFQPQFWRNQRTGKIYADCPGLLDTRGLQFELKKSFFLKKLANITKSYKILLIFDHGFITTARHGNFIKMINQIKDLFPKISIQQQTSLIVTKCGIKITPEHVVKGMKNNVQLDYKEKNISIVNQPSDLNKNLDLDVDAITDKIVPINHPSELLVTGEVKEQLWTLLKSLDDQFQSFIETIKKNLVHFYFQILQASLDEENSIIESIYKDIKSSEQNIKKVDTRQIFVKQIKEEIIKLNFLGQKKAKLRCDETLKNFERKLETYEFIIELLGKEQSTLSTWTHLFEINIQLWKKSEKRVTLKGKTEFNAQLSRLGIDVNEDLKKAIHKTIVSPTDVIAKYEGIKVEKVRYTINGQAQFHGTWTKNDIFKTKESIHCKGYAPYNLSKQVTHKQRLRYCQHTSCLFCNHDYKDYFGTGMATCSGQEKVDKYVEHPIQKPYNAVLNHKGKVSHSQIVQEEKDVPYKGDHKVKCKDHHNCKCKELVTYLRFIRDTILEVQYCKNIHHVQLGYLKQKNGLVSRELQITASLSQKLSKYKLNLESLLASDDSTIVSQTIHDQLTTDYSFDVVYEGKQHYEFPYKLYRKVEYGGSQVVYGQFQYQTKVPFDGSFYISKKASYTATIYKSSCSVCLFCIGITSKEIKFSGTTTLSGNISYLLKQEFKNTYNYSEDVPYRGSEVLEFKGTHSGETSIKDSHKACCKKDKLGKGHHDCTSCSLWADVLSALKELVQEREKFVRAIREKENFIKEKFLQN